MVSIKAFRLYLKLIKNKKELYENMIGHILL